MHDRIETQYLKDNVPFVDTEDKDSPYQINRKQIKSQFEYGGTTFNLVNHYYPSSSHYARLIHNENIKNNWINTDNLIMAGDWNWIPDYSRDITRYKTVKHDTPHNVTELTDTLNNLDLIDSYIETYEIKEADHPIKMTYSHNGTLKRIDRFYHQTQINHLVTNLIDYEDNQCGLSHTLPGAHSLGKGIAYTHYYLH